MKELKELFKLDKNIPVPLYYQLKQVILRQIESGTLKPGDSLPTEAELCESLNISRPTIRQAFGELVSDGYLYRLKGKGTFVSTPKIEEKFFTKLESFNQEMIQKGLTPSTQVLEFKVVNGIPAVNEALQISLEERLIYLQRLRFANEEPIVYVETFLPYGRFSELFKENLAEESLYDILEEKYKMRVQRVTRQIEAMNASTKDSEYLKIQKKAAVCLVKTTGYTSDEIPVEYSVARYRGDRNKFSIDLFR